MESIKLSNISFQYNDFTVFDRLTMQINKGINTAIIGTGACGKTTLAKIFAGVLKYSGSIIINGVEIVKDNFYLLKRYVSVITNERYTSTNMVIDELFNSLNDLNLTVEEEETRVNKIVKFFKLENVLETRVSTCTKRFKNYLKIIKALIRNSEYIVFDDVFVNMEETDIKRIVKYCKNNNITIVYLVTIIFIYFYSNEYKLKVFRQEPYPFLNLNNSFLTVASNEKCIFMRKFSDKSNYFI